MKAKLLLGTVITGFMGAVVMPLAAHAAVPTFQLQPFEFVGTAAECGVAGTDTVTAKWNTTMGNTAPALLLEKQGPTANCAAAGVDIVSSLEGQPVSSLTSLSFDYMDGGHCGGGAPRFNLGTNQGYAFLGCASGTQSSLGNGWTHVTFDATQIAAGLTASGVSSTATLDDLYIIFDEGTDTPVTGAGSVLIDNIGVNGQVVGSPTKPLAKDDCKNDGWKSFNPTFTNQGQCVSSVVANPNSQVRASKVMTTNLAQY